MALNFQLGTVRSIYALIIRIYSIYIYIYDAEGNLGKYCLNMKIIYLIFDICYRVRNYATIGLGAQYRVLAS